MKKIKFVVLSFLVFSFTSCDPQSCVDYLIFNDLNSNIILRSHLDSNFIDQEIESKTSKSQLSNCSMGSNPAILFFTNDSIQIIMDDIVKKTYYPDSEGKNIFNTRDRDSWRLVESRDHYSKFVFEITEEDLE